MFYNFFNFFKDKEKQRERDKLSMELAMAQFGPNKLIEELEIQKQMDKHRSRLEEVKMLNYKAVSQLAHFFYRYGQMEETEYSKFLLDETGTYIPKIKKNNETR